MKFFLFFVCIVVGFALLYFSRIRRYSDPEESFDGTIENTQSNIRRWIENMTQLEGDGWYIIFQEPTSDKFVQFAWGEHDGLLFDLPTQQLSTAELDKAKGLLRKHHIPLETDDGIDQFIKRIGPEKDLAAELAHTVLYQVYGFAEDTTLSVRIDR
jgi:hypothetical protein